MRTSSAKSRTVSSIRVLGGVLAGCIADESLADRCTMTWARSPRPLAAADAHSLTSGDRDVDGVASPVGDAIEFGRREVAQRCAGTAAPDRGPQDALPRVRPGVRGVDAPVHRSPSIAAQKRVDRDQVGRAIGLPPRDDSALEPDELLGLPGKTCGHARSLPPPSSLGRTQSGTCGRRRSRRPTLWMQRPSRQRGALACAAS